MKEILDRFINEGSMIYMQHVVIRKMQRTTADRNIHQVCIWSKQEIYNILSIWKPQ